MARGKRRPPMQPQVVLPHEHGPGNDEVDDFVAQRHKVMLEKTVHQDSESEDIGSEPELRERDVLNIDMSDSDSDSSPSHSLAEDNDATDNLEERKGWGGKKKLWYGADTHEYEIMDDDERKDALKEEEEEALRLQHHALLDLDPEDCRDEEDEETDAGFVDKDEDARVDGSIPMVNPTVAASVLQEAAPEVSILVQEMFHSQKEAALWRERVHWNEVARIRYHLHATFVNNVAFYLSLRTDPDSEGVDLRIHPVLVQILRIRSLLKEALALPCEELPSKPCTPPLHAESMGSTAQESKTANENAKSLGALQPGNVHPDKTRKRKKRRSKTETDDALDQSLREDEEKLQEILPERVSGNVEHLGQFEQERKRRKLNKLVGAMERDRKNKDTKQAGSADADLVRPEPKKATVPVGRHVAGEGVTDQDDLEDDDEVMKKMVARKEKKDARKARKEAEAEPHVYRFKDNVDIGSRRKASSQVVKNRGLTRYRPKDKKTPRTKNRLAYSKAIVRRKGAVRDYAGTPGSNYSGEASGINMSARKGSRLSNV